VSRSEAALAIGGIMEGALPPLWVQERTSNPGPEVDLRVLNCARDDFLLVSTMMTSSLAAFEVNGAAGFGMLATAMRSWYGEVFASGGAIRGCQYVGVEMSSDLKDFLASDFEAEDDFWRARWAGEEYDKAKAEEVLLKKDLFDEDDFNRDFDAGEEPEHPFLFPGAVTRLTKGGGGSHKEYQGLAGAIIWGMCQQVTKHNARSFTEFRPKAVREACGVTKEEEGPLSVERFPGIDLFKRLGILARLFGARKGLIVHSVVSWNGEMVTDKRAPVWASVVLLRNHGMGNVSALCNIMSNYREMIRGNHVLVSEARVASLMVMRLKTLTDHERLFNKAIYDNGFVPIETRLVKNIVGAAQIVAASARRMGNINVDFGARAEVANHARAFLIARGTLESTPARETNVDAT